MRFIIIFILFLNCKKDILKTENDLVWQNSLKMVILFNYTYNL